MIDLCAILPTLLEELTAVGASSIRIVRVMRLLRVFRVLHFAGLDAEAEAMRAAFWAGVPCLRAREAESGLIHIYAHMN